MPGHKFRSLTWKLLLKNVVYCQLIFWKGSEFPTERERPCFQNSLICLQEVKLIMFPPDLAKQNNNLAL